jgi:serine/threonine protein kinase
MFSFIVIAANIFLTAEGNCLKLGDFGSAVKIKAHTTVPGELKGFVGTQGISFNLFLNVNFTFPKSNLLFFFN